MTTPAIPADIREAAANALNIAEDMTGTLFSERVDVIAQALLAEREHAASLTETVDVPTNDMRMKLALKVAARAIRRGRHLTAEEKLKNVTDWLKGGAE